MIDGINEILNATQYSVVATVTPGGAPWNVPVRFVFDDSAIYFRSSPDAVHSKNIAANPNVSVAIFDTTQAAKGAIYINSRAEVLGGEEEARAIELFNQRFNNPPDQWERTYYFGVDIGTMDTEKSIERMYYFQERA